MPLGPAALAVPATEEGVLKTAGIEFLGLLRGDDANLVVLAAVLASSIADGVDVQARGCGLARQLAQTVNELLLKVVGQVVLSTEEDDTALGDCDVC